MLLFASVYKNLVDGKCFLVDKYGSVYLKHRAIRDNHPSGSVFTFILEYNSYR